MDENLQKIDDFAGSGGGGGVTNTGDLTAGHVVVGNDGVDLKADPMFSIGIVDGPGGFVGKDDTAFFELESTDGTSLNSYWTQTEFAINDNIRGQGLCS